MPRAAIGDGGDVARQHRLTPGIERLDALRLLGEQRSGDAEVVARLFQLDADHAQPAIGIGDLPREFRAHGSRIGDQPRIERDAPVSWFPPVASQLVLLDRLDIVRTALAATRFRAASFMPVQTLAVAQPLVASTFVASPLMMTFAAPVAGAQPKLLGVVHNVIAAQRSMFQPRILQAASIDLATVATLDLSAAQRMVNERSSLGDIAAGDHNRPDLASRAVQELENIGRVAACLHAAFAEAAPAIRLGWAELLSGFDDPAPLSALSALPSWNGLPIALRRKQQGLVDWLFGRIDRNLAPAVSAMNELVRVCLLMSAHAPVDRVIPARLVAPVLVRPGVRLDLALDISVARIGMTALLRDAEARPVGMAVVDDLSDGIARGHVLKALTASPVTLAAGLRVELTG